MIKGFGYFALFVFLMFCTQIGGFSSGFAVWFLSVLTVVSGTVAFSCLQFPKELENGMLKRLLAFESHDPKELIVQLEELAQTVRRDGLLATESLRKELKDPLVRYLLKRVMDGYEKVQLNQFIRNHLIRFQELFAIAKNGIDHGLQVVPVVGLIGSLFMIMGALNRPQASVAAAFIPFVLSLILQQWLQAVYPERLIVALDRCRLYFTLLEEGMNGIQDGVNAELLRDKMLGRLAEDPKWTDT